MTATGIHLLDLSVRLLGPAESVLCICEQLSSDLPQGDTVAAYVKFKGGGTSYVSASLANPFMSRFTVYGSKGWIDIRDKAHVEEPGWLDRDTRPWRAGRSPRSKCRRPNRSRTIWWPLPAPSGARAAYPITADHLVNNIALLEAVFASALSGKHRNRGRNPHLTEDSMKALIFDEPKKLIVTEVQIAADRRQ